MVLKSRTCEDENQFTLQNWLNNSDQDGLQASQIFQLENILIASVSVFLFALNELSHSYY